MATTEVPPGWHDDPNGARVLRWWDGTQWTDYIAARRYEALPAEQLETEQEWAPRAHYALIGIVVAQIILALIAVWMWRYLIDEVDTAIDSDGDDPPGFSFMPPFWLVPLALQAVLALWLHAAAAFSRSVGLPARREPGLAAASFFIPVVNFWWPYQSICDTLPVGHPGRRRVLRWWLLNVAGFVAGGVIVVGIAFVPGPAGYLLAMGLVTAVGIPMAVIGQAMIAEIGDVHRDLLVERRLTASVS